MIESARGVTVLHQIAVSARRPVERVLRDACSLSCYENERVVVQQSFFRGRGG